MFPLTKWSPSKELASMRRDIDELFNRMFGRSEMRWPTGPSFVWGAFPAVDIAREGDNIVVHAEIPGVNPKDIDITVTGNILNIKGERKEEKKIEEEDYYYRELGMGAFERSLTLPVDVDTEKIQANYRNGLLEISMPVAEAVKGRKVEISVEEPEKLKAA